MGIYATGNDSSFKNLHLSGSGAWKHPAIHTHTCLFQILKNRIQSHKFQKIRSTTTLLLSEHINFGKDQLQPKAMA